METITAPGHRRLPPVPRPAVDDRGTGAGTSELPPAAQPKAARPAGPPRRRRSPEHTDAAQQFVRLLRASAPAFAAAAGAVSAVVPEAVPPARHRRARCRVVLRLAGGDDFDVTFVGAAAGRRGQLPADFDEQITAWLRAGRPVDRGWVVDDPDAAAGMAVDLLAWAAQRSGRQG